MKSTLAEMAGGRCIGALFFIGFVSAWLLFSLLLREQLSWLTGASVVAGGLGLGAVAVRLLARARQLPLVEPVAAELARRKRAGSLFHWINGGQWVPVALLDWLLTRTGHQNLILPMVLAVIGLHFLPLARLFGYLPHYVTGVGLLTCAVGCGVLPNPATQWGLLALGAGLILWASAGYALWGADVVLRRGA